MLKKCNNSFFKSYNDIIILKGGRLIKLYDTLDTKSLDLLGKGTQGSVYKIDTTKCIKVFKKSKSCKDELHSMLISQIDSHFPKLYSYGDLYIVREYISGISLDEYLLLNPLTEDICHKIMEIYLAMKYVGFKRLDSALFHIFLCDSDKVKIIDTAKAMKKDYFYPHIIIKSLSDLNYKDYFLSFVKDKYPHIYYIWKKNSHILT